MIIHDCTVGGIFSHWTNKDLFRAIDNPEIKEPGPAQDAEIAEYVEELRKRKDKSLAEQMREAELRSRYQI